MLPNSTILDSMYFGKDSLSSKLSQNCLFIDCSTISPFEVKRIGGKLKEEFGIEFLDAPVSGGAVGARNATLSFMVGANNEQLFEVGLSKEFS